MHLRELRERWDVVRAVRSRVGRMGRLVPASGAVLLLLVGCGTGAEGGPSAPARSPAAGAPAAPAVPAAGASGASGEAPADPGGAAQAFTEEGATLCCRACDDPSGNVRSCTGCRGPKAALRTCDDVFLSCDEARCTGTGEELRCTCKRSPAVGPLHACCKACKDGSEGVRDCSSCRVGRGRKGLAAACDEGGGLLVPCGNAVCEPSDSDYHCTCEEDPRDPGAGPLPGICCASCEAGADGSHTCRQCRVAEDRLDACRREGLWFLACHDAECRAAPGGDGNACTCGPPRNRP